MGINLINIPYSQNITILIVFLFIFSNLLFISFRKNSSFVDFALNNKKIRSLQLFFTIIATNLSAFTIFGVTGASYKYGFAFFPVMGFGTAFMTFSFILIGIPLRKLSLEYETITVSEIIEKRVNSKFLALLFSLFTLYFTLPYIATQIYSAGNIISSITGLNYKISSFIFIFIITIYILFGGMKSIIKTDIFQFIILFIFSIIFFFIILSFLIRNKISFLNYYPALQSRNGIDNSLTPITLLSYYLLWFLADPLFPHLNHRFIGSDSDKSILRSMIFYPFALLFVFLSMNIVGVYGRILYPDLTVKDSDNIIKILIINKYPLLIPLFYISALAAIMSTLDSQLLSSSIIIVNDIIKFKVNKIYSKEKQKIFISKLVIILISFLAYLISLKPPMNILNFLTSSSFSGYAILFPILISTIYLPFINKYCLIFSLISGFILVILEALKIIITPIPNVIFNFLAQTFIIITGILAKKLIKKIKGIEIKNINELIFRNEYLNKNNLFIFIISFLLGFDFYNYKIKSYLIIGIPCWYIYHIFVLIILSFLFYIIYKNSNNN